MDQSRLDPAVLGVIALGGGIGSVLRYWLSHWTPASEFPVATLVTNLIGSLLLGMLVVAVTEVWRPHRLVRPLFGTGLLGGFTTFSAFALETHLASFPVALAYVGASVAGGLLCAAAGMSLVRALEPRLAVAATHEHVDPLDPDLP